MRSNHAQALISELETEDFESFTDGGVGEDVIDLRKTIDRLEFQCARRLDLFARRRGYEAFGCVTLISWLRRACRLLAGAAWQRAEVARNLPSLPDTSQALANGEIGFHHAAVIAHSVTEVGVEAVARQESVLLEAAQSCDPKRLSYATRTIRYCEDADGALAADNKNYDLRYLTSARRWTVSMFSTVSWTLKAAPSCAPQSPLASAPFTPTVRRRAASAARPPCTASAASTP